MKLSSGKLRGTPPCECLGPFIILCSGKPSPLISPNTVSPPSASKFALSLGTPVIYFDSLRLGVPIYEL
jgi:hypothetical protein